MISKQNRKFIKYKLFLLFYKVAFKGPLSYVTVQTYLQKKRLNNLKRIKAQCITSILCVHIMWPITSKPTSCRYLVHKVKSYDNSLIFPAWCSRIEIFISSTWIWTRIFRSVNYYQRHGLFFTTPNKKNSIICIRN